MPAPHTLWNVGRGVGVDWNGARMERSRDRRKDMRDADDINTLNAEDRQYRMWEYEQKNRIFRIFSTEKRQKEWTRLFGIKEEQSDDYLNGDVF